ncbi:MAG: hypothetical protein IKD70_05925 [Eggerthellaceae bacterium]|nr:hypothetical protein [Eggerthellaceae bacterium]
MEQQPDIEALFETIANTPILDLAFGDAQLRRKLSRSYKSIMDVLDLSEAQIDKQFEWRDADVIVGLKELRAKNPDAFVKEVMGNSGTSPSERPAPPLEVELGMSKTQVKAPLTKGKTDIDAEGIEALQLSSWPKLYAYEKRANVVFDKLQDRFSEVMVYQVFDEFATELDDISNAFKSLFEGCRYFAKAEELIERHFSDAFLIYVADTARSVYKNDNLWGNFFQVVPVSSSAQTDFKELFVRCLEKRELPTYGSDDETFHYLYTALLHGGLSAESWDDLWEKTLLPLAGAVMRGTSEYGWGTIDGRAILREMKDAEGPYRQNTKGVLKILEKASVSAIGPLLESAFSLAMDIEEKSERNPQFTMMSNNGLPDMALQALSDYLDRRVPKGSRGGKATGSRQPKSIYLPRGAMQLDLARRSVFIRWTKQQFPLRFAGYRLDYMVDGELKQSQTFQFGVGKSILDGLEIEVPPLPRYDVELRLMRPNDDGSFEALASEHQSFVGEKPHCFEFIRDTTGVFNMRSKNERILRQRQVAYLVKDGYSINPGAGMTLIAEYETGSDWKGTKLFLFDVKPGSGGAIIDGATGEEIAVWQERYMSSIYKQRIIGETAEGFDLFGFLPSQTKQNDGLPIITIEALDGMKAIDDLEVECTCDGTRVALFSRSNVLWSDEYEGGAAKIIFDLGRYALDWHIERCDIVIRQKSVGGRAVFRYRFAAVPIQEFQLKSVSFEFGVAVASYEFRARLPLRVIDSRSFETEVNPWGWYAGRTLLGDEFLDLTLETPVQGKATHARLGLAAIEITLPDRLKEIADNRPVCLPDILDAGSADGRIIIRSKGWRYNRKILLLLGQIPVFFLDVPRPAEYPVNLATLAGEFKVVDGTAADRTLTLVVFYGDSLSGGVREFAHTDIPLLNARQGFGFTGWSIVAKADGSHVLILDAPVCCDLEVTFTRLAKDKILGSYVAEQGNTEIPLPDVLVRGLDAHRAYLAIMIPIVGLYGPNESFATEYRLSR